MYQSTQSKRDHYLKVFLRLSGHFSILAVALIFVFVTKESLGALSGLGASFMFDESWFPTEGKFNLMPMVLGSLSVAIGALLLAFPLGLFSALFASFYAPVFFRTFYRRSIELYTGIPSVIFGFWGVMKLVPFINEFRPSGQGLLAGILILALMIFPIITLGLISSFEMASQNHYKISASLGIRKSTYIWSILLPGLKGQILGISMLSLGRALGETMAVLMVCGNIVKVPSSLFDPVRTLTANIALEMAYAMGTHRSALFLSGLLLLVIVGLLYLFSDFLNRRFAWKQ